MVGGTKYLLGICELYNKSVHGYDENSDSRVLHSHLVNTLIELENFYNNSFLENIRFLKRFYECICFTPPPSYSISNYSQIIRKHNYIGLDIIEVSLLNGGEMVACKKTFWLRILQRKWKKIFKLQKEKNEKRKQLFAINYRNIYGKWPKELL
jgi:hypothetical protein